MYILLNFLIMKRSSSKPSAVKRDIISNVYFKYELRNACNIWVHGMSPDSFSPATMRNINPEKTAPAGI